MPVPTLTREPLSIERSRGRLLVVAAAVLWSTSGFFAKAPLFEHWPLVLCGMLGVGFILWFEAQGEQLSGVIFGALSGIAFAGVVLCMRQLRDQDTAWLIALNLAVTTVVLAPWVVAHGIWPTGTQLGYLTAFGMLQLGLPYLLFARGVRWISGHEASGIALLEPILVPVWVFLAWHAEPTYQPPRWWTYAGGALILTGLVWRYAGAQRGRHRKIPPAVDCIPSTGD